MNQPQKNNSQTTDIRQKHINAIRQRLKQKREEYCKTRSDKNILGPGAIHNYLKENYHVYTSQTTIQNFFSNSDGIQKVIMENFIVIFSKSPELILHLTHHILTP